jgi:hypothetical protein
LKKTRKNYYFIQIQNSVFLVFHAGFSATVVVKVGGLFSFLEKMGKMCKRLIFLYRNFSIGFWPNPMLHGPRRVTPFLDFFKASLN